MFRETVTDTKALLIKTLESYKSSFNEAVLRCVIAKQNNENILHWGRVDFTHKSEHKEKKVTDDYGNIILAKRIFTIEEIVSFIQMLPSNTINIQDLENVLVSGQFDNTSYVGLAIPTGCVKKVVEFATKKIVKEKRFGK